MTLNVDLKLLLFLVAFLDIKLPVKIAALIFVYAWQFDLKFKFRFRNSRLPLFYPVIIVIAVINLLINHSYDRHNYLPVFFTGIGFWLIAILVMHQVKLIVERTDVRVIHKTLVVFFILNALVSLGDLAWIVLKTQNINPYTFMGMHQKYFLNTGDMIRGITFDIAPTNAVLNALGVIYFLVKKNAGMLMICMATLLLTYNNLICLMLLMVLGLLFIFKTDSDQKSMVVICLGLFLIAMVKLSPQNSTYVAQVFRTTFHVPQPATQKPGGVARITDRPDSTLTFNEKREKIATIYNDSLNDLIRKRYLLTQQAKLLKNVPLNNIGGLSLPQPDPNSPALQALMLPDADRMLMLNFIADHKAILPLSNSGPVKNSLPGKALGFIQTVKYLHDHPGDLLTGLGIGNFSSKIAFRASGLGLRGNYPKKYTYSNHLFLVNHLDLYMSYYSKELGLHSVSNNPFSDYDQLLSEYGILGLLSLFIFYIRFFLKQHQKLSYGLPIILFVAGIFFLDYWFEQLSVMVMFELLLFLNIKENEEGSIREVSHA